MRALRADRATPHGLASLAIGPTGPGLFDSMVGRSRVLAQ
jgi:hypothetical protein